VPMNLTLDIEVDESFVERVDGDLLREVVSRALVAEGVGGEIGITLVVTDDEEIRGINAAVRGIDEPTDVLSFPLEGPDEVAVFVTPPGQPRRLGDIVISLPRAEAQAGEYGHSLRRELAYLTVHGTLHLLGYDHEDEVERAAMREREEAALAGIPRA
jgi:probable rRNA maturation factor